MRVPVSMRDRRFWGAIISLSIAVSSGLHVRPAAATGCCAPPPQCCSDRSEVLFAPVPPTTEDTTISWSYIDPIYIFTKVIIPAIYAIIIIRIIWLIQLGR